MGRASKRKGSRAELEVVGLLQEWWRPFEPGTVFVRTPASGGWAHAPGFRARGDVMIGYRDCSSPPSRWPWTVEVKRREGWSPERFLRGGQSPVWAWWAQVQRAAADDHAEPLLIFRRSRAEWLVMLDERAADRAVAAALGGKGQEVLELLEAATVWRQWPGRGLPMTVPLVLLLRTPPSCWAR